MLNDYRRSPEDFQEALSATKFKYFYCWVQNMSEVKVKYRCTACNWKFTRTTQPRLCPYCGKATVDIYKAQGAQELLKEIEEAEQGFQASV